MSNVIPRASRDTVERRDRGRCQRCGSRGTDWHHRKRRREGGHGAENGVTLCRVCHSYVHAHPAEARTNGWIVSLYAEPAEEPMRTYSGWVLLRPDGSMTEAPTPEVEHR